MPDETYGQTFMRDLDAARLRRQVEKSLEAGSSSAQLRQGRPQGMFSEYFGAYVPREVSPAFYEVLREAIPVIDEAISRLISLNGILVVEGDNQRLVDELTDFADNVPVNDFQVGIQAYLKSFQNEAFEQGFVISEHTMTSDLRDIERLWVADSKDIHFRRDETTGRMEVYYRPHLANPGRINPTGKPGQILAGVQNVQGFYALASVNDIKLQMDNKYYFSLDNENQNPYGVSKMRSTEFVSKFLVTIENAGMNLWERYGDPSYHVKYKTGKKGLEGKTIEERRKAVEKQFSDTITAKRKGKSGDFVTATDPDSEIDITIIGADNAIVLDMEKPTRHALEMIVSKMGLPPWMLGLHWSTTERLADKEVEMVLMDTKIRQAAMLPNLNRLFGTVLRARGRSWKRNDWRLRFETPNLHDLLAQAQAGFLNAQAAMMQSGVVQGGAQRGTTTSVQLGASSGKLEIKLSPALIAPTKGHDAPLTLSEASISGNDTPLIKREMVRSLKSKLADYRKNWHKPACCGDESTKDRSPEALQIQSDYENALKDGWAKTLERILSALGLDLPEDDKNAKTPVSFSDEDFRRVKEELDRFVANMQANSLDMQGPVVTYTGRAHALGLVQAAAAKGSNRPILDLMKNEQVFNELLENGFDLVKLRSGAFYDEEVKRAMEDGIRAGVNPKEIARTLKRTFEGFNPNWERLARSEVTLAQERGKKDEWAAWKVKRLHFSPAPGACPVCQALAGDYDIADCPVAVQDTHPHCTCSTTLAASEL